MNVWIVRALAGLAVLVAAAVIVLDLTPGFMGTASHGILSAVPLAVIAVANITYHVLRRPRPVELLKALLLSAAFSLWALYQLLSALPFAPIFNDLAISLFVIDVAIIVASHGRPGDDL